jgi:hypothetical protein
MKKIQGYSCICSTRNKGVGPLPPDRRLIQSIILISDNQNPDIIWGKIGKTEKYLNVNNLICGYYNY